MASLTANSFSPKPNPEFRAILESGPPPELPSKDPVELRNITNVVKDQARATAGPPPEGVKEYDIAIPTRDKSKISARVYAPAEGQKQNSPLFVFFHGGGYCIGSSKDESETNRVLALEVGITVVSIEYRLAPEHRFPTCVHDGFDALTWIIENSASLHTDPSAGLIVGGVSSGGNIAQAIVYMNRDNGQQLKITGQFLSVTNLLPPPVVPEKYKERYNSVEENKDFAIPPQEFIQIFMGAYQPDQQSPLFVPFNHPKGHSQIPPTYLQVCGLDSLRDEELIYESVLREDYKIPTRMDVYDGLPHHFWEFFPQLTSLVEKRIRDTVEGVKWLLNPSGK
ncbi:hypothetical protein LTR10_015980 [Elasticomyces elasticus]|uniref:Alpha/beta hydrolase fold-3 domain-containing protein n=1 Tax=Exophiala sideris TaxID=1016849 RepID=A0ABR0J223_9EURO|nr:hypothetical protein LTR10_015980 [Elasticomyces elasticus]KAK5024682.1 hypothetical protein LTS07_008528 [Exophiala sideris]KAK5030775.1 hypothetical protein LTR13_008129 [Exophiala sideris]KAK5054316.1 hypothetical protein LTR69_008931 [Exophiala sideris]KAK5179718.1 hypothetical protein LTR44_007886 [Eurotiomycetes sp. CCFEE 6388]